ncbi:MAG: hypothetical protein DMG13_08150 [Acidobacteria bacterium]|nr:MAG: hypothetical protein DMG13_08150 [Acidobacteriota bacterium]
MVKLPTPVVWAVLSLCARSLLLPRPKAGQDLDAERELLFVTDPQVAEVPPELVVQVKVNVHEFGQLACVQPVNALDRCESGARSAWHTHPLGQTLIVTAGAGGVQQAEDR